MTSDKKMLLTSLEYALSCFRMSDRYKAGNEKTMLAAGALSEQIDLFKEEFKGEIYETEKTE